MSLLQQADPTCCLVFPPLRYIHTPFPCLQELPEKFLHDAGQAVNLKAFASYQERVQRGAGVGLQAFPAVAGKARFIFCYFFPLLLFFSTCTFLNWRILLYSIVLVSAKHQHESALSMSVSLPSWTSLPIPPFCVVTEPGLSSLKFPLAIYFIYGNIITFLKFSV